MPENNIVQNDCRRGKPDSGEIRLGETVDLGYVNQSRDELNPDKTVWEEISDGLDMIEIGKQTIPSRAYVGQFNFKGSDQQKKSVSFPAVNAIVYIWPRCSRKVPT